MPFPLPRKHATLRFQRRVRLSDPEDPGADIAIKGHDMSDPLTYHRRFRPAELDAHYNLRARRPDFEPEILPAWTRASAAARAALDHQVDIRYGDGDRQALDVFHSGAQGAPVLVYLHGGYWQGGDKALYSFIAPPFVAAGIDVAIVGYDLCPTVTITQITEEIRQALAYLWRNAARLGLDRDRIALMGHSAGGHLTQMMLATDWPAYAPDLPADLVKAAVPLSPVSYLEPIRLTEALNAALRLTPEEAEAQSPMTRHPPLTTAPQLLAVGGAETDEFHRQARMYLEAYGTPARAMELTTVPGVDHFDLLNVLTDPASPFFARVSAFVHAAG